jgi:hypothetical protein
VLSGKWVWKIKTGPDGAFERCKARWVVRGDRQQPGIDFDETFSPVVKLATIRTVLTLIASKQWPAHQLDVSNAFLHSHLNERVYCQQPPGFEDPARPNDVCLLSRSVYGLRQAPRAWFQRFVEHAVSIGFQQSRTDSSLFIYKRGDAMAYLLLYVDDIILSASSQELLQHFVRTLKYAFAIKDLGPVSYFLGVEMQRNRDGFLLSQSSYALDVLERAGMTNCKPVATPAETISKASTSDATPLSAVDASWYRSMAGALQYLTLTRPDIAYAVQQACLHMHAPTTAHCVLLKRILRYLKGTASLGLQLLASSSPTITAYTDVDWAAAQIHGAQRPDLPSSSATRWCHGLPSAKLPYPDLAQRLNTVALRTQCPSVRGCGNFYRNCTAARRRRLAYCDNVSSTTLSIIGAPST